MVALLPLVEILLIQILVGQHQRPQTLPCELLQIRKQSFTDPNLLFWRWLCINSQACRTLEHFEITHWNTSLRSGALWWHPSVCCRTDAASRRWSCLHLYSRERVSPPDSELGTREQSEESDLNISLESPSVTRGKTFIWQIKLNRRILIRIWFCTYDGHPLAEIVEVQDGQELVAALPSHFHDGNTVRRSWAEDETKVSGCCYQSALIWRLGQVEQLACRGRQNIDNPNKQKYKGGRGTSWIPTHLPSSPQPWRCGRDSAAWRSREPPGSPASPPPPARGRGTGSGGRPEGWRRSPPSPCAGETTEDVFTVSTSLLVPNTRDL